MKRRRIIKTAVLFCVFPFLVSCARNDGVPLPAGEPENFEVPQTVNPFDAPPGPEIRYVGASDGLVLREGPSVSAPRKAVLPQFTRLTVISRGNATEHLGGKTGFWLEVEALGQTGWVFGGETIDQPVLKEAFIGEWLEEPEVSPDTEEDFVLLYNYYGGRYFSFRENGEYGEGLPETDMGAYGGWTWNGKELVRELQGPLIEEKQYLGPTHHNRAFFESRDRLFIEGETPFGEDPPGEGAPGGKEKGIWLGRIDRKLDELIGYNRSRDDISRHLSSAAAPQRLAFGHVPFTYVLSQDKPQIARYILEDHKISLSHRDIWGRTPLMYAAVSGDSALVSAVLDRGAALTGRDMWNRTPLFYAAGARKGDDGIVRALLEKGADINGRSKAGRTPLMYAVVNEHAKAALALLAAGADPSVKDNDGNTVLHLFCRHVRNPSMLGVLEKLAEGADPNPRNNESLTPLDLTMLNRRETPYGADEYGDRVRELLRAAGARYSTPEKQREAEPHHLTVAPGTKEIKEREYADKGLLTLTLPPGLESIGVEGFAFNRIGSLTLPGSVSSTGRGAFQGNRITRLVLENGLTVINEEAFSDNPLESAAFPETLRSIENAAFIGCRLKTLVLPGSVTSIGRSAFYGNQLRELTLSRNLEEISYHAFSRNRLTAVELPPSVKKVANAAFSYNPLTTITIGADVAFDERSPPRTEVYPDAEYTFGAYGASFFRDYNGNGKKAGTYTYDRQTEKWSCR
ncbi:MAG: leucine-rich repeat protein [Treponema sp.]|jgi:ankyrin repeat protein|nr:leucine-rich repeat protein [Treponema sp.]